MVPVARAPTIKTVEANIEASGIIDRVKALRAVFSVYRLRWPWWTELWHVLVSCGLKT
jgi:hypothetical protein